MILLQVSNVSLNNIERIVSKIINIFKKTVLFKLKKI